MSNYYYNSTMMNIFWQYVQFCSYGFLNFMVKCSSAHRNLFSYVFGNSSPQIK